MEGKEQEINIDETKKGKKAIDELKKATKEFNKEQEKEEKQTKANTSAIKKAKDALGDFKDRVGDTTDALKNLYAKDAVLMGGIVGLGSSLIKTATSMLTFNSELHRTVINAGKGAAGAEAYSKTVVNLGKSMSATQEDAEKIVKTLAEFQYLGTDKEIESAAEASYGLARAFNIEHEEVAQNTVELQKWGQVSAKTTTAMYADLMKVAQANGLTKGGVKAVMKTTTEWSGMLKAFGKTAPMDVQRYNMSLAKTVSALEKVGVSAETSTKLLADLTDPTQIEDNIPKYAALGISITDAISGNIDPERMGAGLKEFGEKLKQMGPIAGAQYAKAMGVSYKDAIKAASADMAEASQVDMTPEEKSAEAMKQLTEATKDTTEKIQDIFTGIGAKLRSFGPLAMIVGGTLINFFMKKTNNAKKESLKASEENIKKEKKTKLEAIQEEIEFLTKKKEEGYQVERKLQNKIEEQQKLQHIKNIKEEAAMKRKIVEEMAMKYVKDDGEIEQHILESINKEKNEKIKAQQEIIDQMIKKTEAANNKITNLEEEIAKAATDAKKEQLRKEVEDTKKAIKEIEKAKVAAEKEANRIEKDLNIENLEQAKKEIKERYDELSKSMLVRMGRGIGKIKDNINSLPSTIKTKIGNIEIKGDKVGEKIGKGLVEAGEAVKDKLSKIKIGVKQASGSGAGKMLKTLGGIGKTLGVMGIVMAIISKVLTKIGNPLESLIDSLVDVLAPIIEAILPPVLKVLTVLVKALLPPILRILSLLMKILGVTIVPILGFLLKGLSKMFPFLGFLGDVADGISEAFGPKTQKALNEAADSVSHLGEKTEENTEETKKSNENKKEQLQIGKNGRVTVTKAQHKEEEKEEKKTEETNSSQAVANNTNKNAQTAAIKETNNELSDIKNLISQFMNKLSEIIEKNNNNGMEMARAVEIGCKQAYQDGVPVKVKEMPSEFIGRKITWPRPS